MSRSQLSIVRTVTCMTSLALHIWLCFGYRGNSTLHSFIFYPSEFRYWLPLKTGNLQSCATCFPGGLWSVTQNVSRDTVPQILPAVRVISWQTGRDCWFNIGQANPFSHISLRWELPLDVGTMHCVHFPCSHLKRKLLVCLCRSPLGYLWDTKQWGFCQALSWNSFHIEMRQWIYIFKMERFSWYFYSSLYLKTSQSSYCWIANKMKISQTIGRDDPFPKFQDISPLSSYALHYNMISSRPSKWIIAGFLYAL